MLFRALHAKLRNVDLYNKFEQKKSSTDVGGTFIEKCVSDSMVSVGRCGLSAVYIYLRSYIIIIIINVTYMAQTRINAANAPNTWCCVAAYRLWCPSTAPITSLTWTSSPHTSGHVSNRSPTATIASPAIGRSKQGRRSLWDRGDTSPNIWTGGHYHEYPPNISRVISATFYPCNIFLISWRSF